MRIFIIVLGLIGAACAVPPRPRIVGGEPTTIENYPFMACPLVKSWDGEFFQYCGGTLVSSTAVVSAAHCFDDLLEVSLWRMRLGTNDRTSGGTVHIVSNIIIHPGYSPILATSDIAVMRLSNHAVLSNKIQIARIAGPRYPLPDNSLVDVIGWGALGWVEYNGDSPDILHAVEVNVINHQICTLRYAYLKTLPGMEYSPDVTPNMLCTGILDVGGKDGCQGDSGGPVIHNKDVLVGVTSWGHECAHPTYPGVNARVTSYADWIYTNSLNNSTLN